MRIEPRIPDDCLCDHCAALVLARTIIETRARELGEQAKKWPADLRDRAASDARRELAAYSQNVINFWMPVLRFGCRNLAYLVVED